MVTRSRPAESGAGLVCLGVVTGARGLRGEVRVKTFTGEPADLAAYGPLSDEAGGRQFNVTVTGLVKGQAIVRFAGVDDRTAADALKGTSLFVPRSALPAPDEGEFYHQDLVGLAVDLVGGGTLGVVRAVYDFGAGDLLEVVGDDGRQVMVPFTLEVVPEVDLVGRRLVVDPPLGLLEPPPSEPDDDAEEGDGS